MKKRKESPASMPIEDFLKEISYLRKLKRERSLIKTLINKANDDFNESCGLEGDYVDNKIIRPSVRLMHQAYIAALEDALTRIDPLIEYFAPQKAKPAKA